MGLNSQKALRLSLPPCLSGKITDIHHIPGFNMDSRHPNSNSFSLSKYHFTG